MSTPRKRRATTEKLINEILSSSDEDAGSGFESGFSDDEEMFFNGMDPVQDDPRLTCVLLFGGFV